MKSAPLVTVVVPCLNRARYLAPTIDSILGQDYPEIECVVVDGGSTDGTVEILEGYGDRVQWVSEPDEGHADAINKGWRIGHGEILAWLNADDLWEVPDAVRAVIDAMQDDPGIDVLYGACGAIDEAGNLLGMAYQHDWDLAYAVEHCDHCIPQPAAFIRRAILDKVGWLDTNFYQKKDHELWLRIGLQGTIRYLPRRLAYARDLVALSQDGRTAAPACVQVTRRFFSLAGVPSDIHRRRRRAMSNAYLRGMQYAYEGGRHWDIVFDYGQRALLHDPSNAAIILFALHLYAKEAHIEERRYQHLHSALTLAAALRRSTRTLAHDLHQVLDAPRTPNLAGYRDIEWSFVAAHLPPGHGEALDFGAGGSNLALMASQRGFHVTTVDLQPHPATYLAEDITTMVGDLLHLPLDDGRFDLIINCSTIEHVGLAGRYGITIAIPDGDLLSMERLRRLMRPGATMLLTVPIGHDAVFPPMCRVYGQKRLPRLLEGFDIALEQYWTKGADNLWRSSAADEALDTVAHAGNPDPLQNYHALGGFVLVKS
jgi:glycosyltransferase involved in cell wall biosynthesis/SAM-dependent methyltransferase